MAFSNTVGQATFTTRKVIDRAFGRCKVVPQHISAEYIDIAKFYSTPGSSTFINGVLDKIVEALTEEGKLKKTGRGLI